MNSETTNPFDELMNTSDAAEYAAEAQKPAAEAQDASAVRSQLVAHLSAEISDKLAQIAELKAKRAAIDAEISAIKATVETAGAELVGVSDTTGEPIKGDGFETRFNKGRATETWDFDKLYAALPEAQRAAFYVLKPQPIEAVIKAAAKAGTLPEGAVKESRVVKEPNARWVFELTK